jgi:uncharacterized protein YecT (DUF1311 family)
MRSAIAMLFAAALAIGAPARAQDAPNPKDMRAVEGCLKAQSKNAEACIRSAYRACIGPNENAKPSSEVTDCLRRERLVWDRLLNDAFRTLRDGLDEDQRVKLRDMQRAWIDMRERTCAFYYDYYQGSMANPMIANCENRETARRAIFLIGFADDLGGGKSRR